MPSKIKNAPRLTRIAQERPKLKVRGKGRGKPAVSVQANGQDEAEKEKLKKDKIETAKSDLAQYKEKIERARKREKKKLTIREKLEKQVAKIEKEENEAARSYQDGGEGMIAWCEDKVCIPITEFIYKEDIDEFVPIKRYCPMGQLPDTVMPDTGRSYKSFWEEQKKVLRVALKMDRGLFIYTVIILCWNRGEGKCQGKGSKVIMFDGTLKKVEDIKVGDQLMGDDNTARTVLALASGKEEMFEVTPTRGSSFTVTADHKMSLKRRRRHVNKRGKPYIDPYEGEITDISVSDYIEQNKSFKALNLLYRVPINWDEQEVPIDPYFLGIWLADGNNANPQITTMDQEVIDYLYEYADSMGAYVSIYKRKDAKAGLYKLVTYASHPNPILNRLRNNNLLHNKHVPHVYKANSREVRMQLLAGLIDGDGYRNRNSYQIATKYKALADDILFLARSLGFHAEAKKTTKHIKSLNFSGEYYVIGITGNCSEIPVRVERRKCTPRREGWKNVLTTGIKEIKSVGEQEYYGFMVDGNGRYLMEDFTVTHNSFLACLIQLWKFFCFPEQKIVLGANSKDQTKFVHYEIMKEIILNSPQLYRDIGGARNVQEKELRLVDAKGNVRSFIRPVSSFTGIFSNVTGYTFSEMFDMKNPKFFTQLDGSTRNIPNALGVIDSTVSAKTHILYRLYEGAVTGRTKKVFFHHRSSKNGDYRDFWHPLMNKVQLDDYREKFDPWDFDMYYKNIWAAGRRRAITDQMIEEMGVIGAWSEGGIKLLDHQLIQDLTETKVSLIDTLDEEDKKTTGFNADFYAKTQEKLNEIEKQVVPVDHYYRLTDKLGGMAPVKMSVLQELSDVFDTYWALLAGGDMSDPLATTSYARTVYTLWAKGLPGSRDGKWNVDYTTGEHKYLYILLNLRIIESASIATFKSYMEDDHNELGGIDTFCAERYGSWDMAEWCEKKDVKMELVHPSYNMQREIFKAMFTSLREGMLKAPRLDVAGSKEADILREEMRHFDHDPVKKWYGSSEKEEVRGVQDDVLYSSAWAIYGGKELTPHDFKERKPMRAFMGLYIPNNELLGRY
jgi:hypothetical protein